MTTVSDTIAAHPFFADIEPRWLEALAQGAYDVAVTGGERLFYQGEPADVLYLVTAGRFVLRAQGVDRTSVRVDAVAAGDVLGWSWMVPPRRWMFDAIATADSAVTAIDARRLRDLCDADAALGYQIMTRVARIMHQRLMAARGQLLDRTGGHHGHC